MLFQDYSVYKKASLIVADVLMDLDQKVCQVDPGNKNKKLQKKKIIPHKGLEPLTF